MDIVFYVLSALCLVACVVLDKVEMQRCLRNGVVKDPVAGADGEGRSSGVLNYTTSVAIVLLAGGGQKEKVVQMLDAGVDVNKRDGNGRTALIAAARRGHVGIVEILLGAGCDVNAADAAGRTALMYAARDGFPVIVKMLLKHGADAAVADLRGQTARDHAEQAGHTDIVDLLPS